MNRIATFVISSTLLCLGAFHSFGDGPAGVKAAPGLIARAKEMVGKHDLSGFDALLQQVDADFAGNYGPDYLTTLLGIRDAVFPGFVDPSAEDWPRLWAAEKILWKVLLAQNSRIEDARMVQGIKDIVVRIGIVVSAKDFPTYKDQFVAMRNDAARLREAYAVSLRQRIVPNYKLKPEMDIDSTSDQSEKVREERRAAYDQDMHNTYQNDEQRVLRGSLLLTNERVIKIIKDYFSWPPQDDAMVNELLGLFPPENESRESVLTELSRLRAERDKDLKFYDDLKKAQNRQP